MRCLDSEYFFMRIFTMKLEDLIETAKIAHLYADEAELKLMFPAFEEMTGLFDAMADSEAFMAPAKENSETGKVVLSNFNSNTLNNSFNNPHNNSLIEEMLNNAGERNGRFIVVPNVL